mgnify:CR=1 FL=1
MRQMPGSGQAEGGPPARRARRSPLVSEHAPSVCRLARSAGLRPCRLPREARNGCLRLPRSNASTMTMEAYAHRFRRVFEHIDQHLDGGLSLERLGAMAGVSKYHFHRQFSATFGVSMHEYVRLLRFRRASFRLAFYQHDSVLAIALASGYDSHEAFSRAFKQVFGQTPSEFRRSPAWEDWSTTYERLRASTASRARSPESRDLRVVDFSQPRVAALEHRGDPKRIGARFAGSRSGASRTASPEARAPHSVSLARRVLQGWRSLASTFALRRSARFRRTTPALSRRRSPAGVAPSYAMSPPTTERHLPRRARRPIRQARLPAGQSFR